MTVGGFSNAASGQQAYAPGMILSVYGSGLGDFAQAVGATPLPSMLAGFEAWVVNVNSANLISAPLYYVSPNQVNLQIPYGIDPGAAWLALGGPWGRTGFISLTVSAAAPGIFMFADGSVNPSSTAHAGDTVVMFVTGDGATSPPVLTGWTPSGRRDAAAAADGIDYGGRHPGCAAVCVHRHSKLVGGSDPNQLHRSG